MDSDDDDGPPKDGPPKNGPPKNGPPNDDDTANLSYGPDHTMWGTEYKPEGGVWGNIPKGANSGDGGNQGQSVLLVDPEADLSDFFTENQHERSNESSEQLAKRGKHFGNLSRFPSEPWEIPMEKEERLKRLASNQVLIKILLDKLFNGYSGYEGRSHADQTARTQMAHNLMRLNPLPNSKFLTKPDKQSLMVSALTSPFKQPRLLTLADVRVCTYPGGTDPMSGSESGGESGGESVTDGDAITSVELICFSAGGAIFALRLSSFDRPWERDNGTGSDNGSGNDKARFQYECAKRLIFVNRDKFDQREQYGICSLANLLEYNRSEGKIRSCRTTSVFGQGGEAVNSLIGSAYRVAGNEHDDWSNECKMMMRALNTANDSHSLEILVADPDLAFIEILIGLGVDSQVVPGVLTPEVISYLWHDAVEEPINEQNEQFEKDVVAAIELGFESISKIKEAKKKPEDPDSDQDAGRRRKYTSKKRSSRKSKTNKKRKNKRTRRQSVEKRRPSARSSRKHSRSKKSR